MGNGCFVGKKFCANGSVPADDKSGAGLGWNIGQVLGATATTKVAITTPVKFSFSGATAGMRVQLSASATVSYCYPLTAADANRGTVTIPLASFMTTAGRGRHGLRRHDTHRGNSARRPRLMAGAAQTFDMCVLDVEPG